MHETVATTDVQQQNAGRGVIQKSGCVPGKGAGTGEQQADDIVSQDR